MSEELEQQIRVMIRQQGGAISPHLLKDFKGFAKILLTIDRTLAAVNVYISIA
jgi:hypothetical protein